MEEKTQGCQFFLKFIVLVLLNTVLYVLIDESNKIRNLKETSQLVFLLKIMKL
jgi:hypothetical protein